MCDHDCDGGHSAPDLICPHCGASVGYDDVQEAPDPSQACCPECGHASDTDDWFA